MIKKNKFSQRPKKEVLLQVAEELFASHGFEGASIRTISEVSGINAAMISYYFGSKEALYTAIFQNRMKDLKQILVHTDKLELGPEEKLRKYISDYIGRIGSHKGFYRIQSRASTILEQPSIRDMVAEGRKMGFELLKKIIIQGSAEGVFRQVDAEILALNILYLLPTLFTRPQTIFETLTCPIETPKGAAELEQRITAYLMSILLKV